MRMLTVWPLAPTPQCETVADTYSTWLSDPLRQSTHTHAGTLAERMLQIVVIWSRIPELHPLFLRSRALSLKQSERRLEYSRQSCAVLGRAFLGSMQGEHIHLATLRGFTTIHCCRGQTVSTKLGFRKGYSIISLAVARNSISPLLSLQPQDKHCAIAARATADYDVVTGPAYA
jgi:hypothetical protein